MKRLSAALAVSVLTAGAAYAGSIESACIKSERQASRSLCSCIQSVADVKLSRSDQKLAAKFFKDPHLAQETRQSSSRSKEQFWQRYKDWGQTAAQTCSG
jgi:hypothetical protein